MFLCYLLSDHNRKGVDNQPKNSIFFQTAAENLPFPVIFLTIRDISHALDKMPLADMDRCLYAFLDRAMI